MSHKVAVVTNSSYGLGLAIIKGLCQKFEGSIYLTSKNAHSGLEAIKQLEEHGSKAIFHILDVSDEESVKNFALFLKEKHGGVDVLVNHFPTLDRTPEYPDYETAKNTIDVSFRSFLTMEEILFPLLRNGAKVINITNNCGHLSNLRNQNWIDLLRSPDLTTEELNDFVEEYLESIKNRTFEREYFANEGKHADERVAKVAVVALTMIQQRKYNGKNISINAVHPGISENTAAGGKVPDEAAKTILYLILDASPNLKGTFMWHDRKLVDWYDAEEDEGIHYCSF